jgi:alkylhydroperoxidase family enzyme
VFDAAAVTPPALRRAAATGESLAEPWRSYTALVRDASYRITDADIAQLTEAGHSEDEVFELTVAAAVGAALSSFDAGSRALENDPA